LATPGVVAHTYLVVVLTFASKAVVLTFASKAVVVGTYLVVVPFAFKAACLPV